MERSARRRAMIGGSTLVVAGALAGVMAFGFGGHGATTPPGAAGTISAQRVDDNAAQPNTADSSVPTTQPSTAATPVPTTQPAQEAPPAGHLTVRVKTLSGAGGRICVENTVNGEQCTQAPAPGQQDTLDVDIKAGETQAKLQSQMGGVNGLAGTAELNSTECMLFDGPETHFNACDKF